MSVRTYEEYESVDLTEDELSSEENSSHKNSPLHFVNCTSDVGSSLPAATIRTSPPPLTPIIKRQVTKNKSNSTQNKTKSSVGKFMTMQIKPPVSTIPETQVVSGDSSQHMYRDESLSMETVCIDSDDENPINTRSTQENTSQLYNTTMYSPKQKGKLVIIKKNNRYYRIVIPHNVMPNANQSSGPVLINIPEVGPLVITTDPQVTKLNTNPVQHPTQQLLNLDDIDQRQSNVQSQNSVLVKPTMKAYEYTAKEEALYNKKFCWTYLKGRKRDLEGFTITDRLGFNRAESQRTRKCSKILDSIVTKERAQLIKLMYNYDKFRASVNRKQKVKLVKINEIVGGTSKALNKTVSENLRMDEPQDVRNMESADYDCDLLLTKKVVFLNKDDKEIPVRKPRVISGIRNQRRLKNGSIRKLENKHKLARGVYSPLQNKLPPMKPCYVEMVREEHVEEAYIKLCKEMGVKYPNPDSEQLLPDQVKFFQNITNLFLSRIVAMEYHFRAEINFLKPMLIVNEYHVGGLDYSKVFCKNNIVYIVREDRNFPTSILRNAPFISAVEMGYVKLVDSQLFCKYLMGNMESVPTIGNHINDHNYCFYKK